MRERSTMLAVQSFADASSGPAGDSQPVSERAPTLVRRRGVERVVRIFPRRKHGETIRCAEQAIVITLETLKQFSGMSLKDAAHTMVRTQPRICFQRSPNAL
jgi:hypothetical protein